MKIHVENLTSSNGNKVANQFVIFADYDDKHVVTFQSYGNVIAQKVNGVLTLDKNALEYSNTTLKYLKIFLKTNKTKSELYKWIESENINATDLN